MPGPSGGTGAGLLPAECPNCGRLHQGYDFNDDPGPVQRERDEWKSLCLDMGEGIREIRRKVVLGMPGGEAVRVVDKCDALLARLSRLGAGDSNPRHGRGPNEKESA